MKLTRLHKIGIDWLNASFTNQITLFALSFTLGVSLLIGAGSYLALRGQIETTIQHDLAAQATLVENRLSHFITQASTELATLSRNSFLSNGLVDSQGRDGYLRPFLRDFRLSLPGKEDASLTLYDFGGKPLIQVRPGHAIDTDTDADAVGQAIATGKSQVRIITQGNESYFRLVQPIHFPPTQSVEGALSVRIQLAPLLANTGIALAESQVLQLHAAGAVVVQIGASQGASREDVLRVERALKLAAPFDTLGLRLTLDSSTRDAHGPLDRLTLIYVVGLLLLLPLVGWVTHRSSRRLVAPLVQLSATANAIASSGVITPLVQFVGPNVVGRLAGAFDRMLVRLGTAHDELNHLNEDLEGKVAARTADLLASEKYLRTIVDAALDAVIRMNEQGLVTDWNPEAERIFGYSHADAVGKHLDCLIIPPPTREAHRRGLEHFLKTGEGPLLGKRIKVTAMRAGGGEFPVEMAIVAIRSGEAFSFNTFLRDITEREEAQARLTEQLAFSALLQEMSPLPTSMLDLEGRYVSVNRAWQEFTGRRREDVLGEVAGDYLEPEEALLHDARDRHLLDVGGRLRYETSYTHPDGSRRALLINKVTVPGRDGQPQGILCTFMDVTELHDAARATQEARDAAEESSRAKSEFIANISHELRTPLQAIIGFSELGTLPGRSPDKLVAMFPDILAAGQRMLALVNDLLDVSKLESAVGAIHLERTDLRPLLREISRELAPLLDAKQLVVEAGLPAAPLVAKVDPLRFQQVLRNVLANAIKFAPRRTRIELVAQVGQDGGAHISVRDHGPGIPPLELEKIFEAFVQSSKTKDGSGGTGLGLAICRKIIDVHGGSMSAENMPDHGSRFHIRLPPSRTSGESRPAELTA